MLPGHALSRDLSTRALPPRRARTSWVRPVEADSVSDALLTATREAVTDSLAAVALSGGHDSAIVLALVRALGVELRCFVLSTKLEGYDERDRALFTSDHFGADTTVINVDEEDFVAALPDAISAMEVPLYNAHPVGKLLLARALARHGIRRVLTGDGADHVMTRDVSADYLPLVGAAFDDAGVTLHAPFLDERVLSLLLACPKDRHKAILREVAHSLGVSDELVGEKKRSRLCPPIPVDHLVRADEHDRLAARLGRVPPAHDADDRARMLWHTTALLLRDA